MSFVSGSDFGELHFDGVFSGLTNNGSKISNTLFNGKFENDTN